MNRRDALKSLAAVPLVGMMKAEEKPSEWPRIVGVKETPWLRGKVQIYCDGMAMSRCIRACVSEGWCEILGGLTRDGKHLTRKVWRGTIRIEWKPCASTFESNRSGV